MIWRLIIVSWAVALLAGLIVYFSGSIAHFLNLGAESGVRLLDLSEVIALLMAILGTIGLCLKLLVEYVLPSQP